jgi:hypothetical protein
MGNLHSGHISLIDLARQHGTPSSPASSSTRCNSAPARISIATRAHSKPTAHNCKAAGCDIVFAPDANEMYPEAQTFSVQPPLADELCGAFRPGHFQGVATVVLKLFNMVQPRYAAFGKKDYQQLFILKGMVRQFNLPIVILEGETGRAEDGLALSSRNGFSEAIRNAPKRHVCIDCCAQRHNASSPATPGSPTSNRPPATNSADMAGASITSRSAARPRCDHPCRMNSILSSSPPPTSAAHA